MPGQEPDIIRITPDGPPSRLCTHPLSDWLHEHGIGPRLEGPLIVRTSNLRMYTAAYLLDDDRLWLEAVQPTEFAVVEARRRERWTLRDDRRLDHELEPEASWLARAAVVDPERRPFDIDGLFPRSDESIVRDVEGRVWANWYTGELRMPRGRLLDSMPPGTDAVYERDLLVTIEKGVVVRAWTRRNE